MELEGLEFFFIVSQIWIDVNGTVGSREYVYEEEEGQVPAVNRALNKYHEILGHGAISDDQYHASQLLRSDGAVIKPYEYYDRRQKPVQESQQTPTTPTEEPEEPETPEEHETPEEP